jgi:hypothetical protein
VLHPVRRNKPRVIVGIITLVQETRFKLAADDGCSKLFVLSHSAAIEPQDLLPLMRRGGRVVVRFNNAESQIAAIANEIMEIDRAPSRNSMAEQ